MKGFKGNLQWIHNEEGSGASFYKSSVYFPDNRKKPVTNSGVTIDPGVDLGNASRSLINDVLNYYRDIGALNTQQFTVLLTSIGLKKIKAAKWMEQYEDYFHKKFLIDNKIAAVVMDKITADDYWLPLLKAMPELEFLNTHHAKAVHTSLLSLSYNRGFNFTINFAKDLIRQNLIQELGEAIKNIPTRVASLRDRRIREGNLILAAHKIGQRFEIQIEDINVMPLTTIPYDLEETIREKFIYEVKKVN